jgi:hypothetical protein
MSERGRQCQVLDSYGRRCRQQAKRMDNYHGDPEIYRHFDEHPKTLVRVWLCEKHQWRER